jgi:hypothetical protein
MTDWGSNSFTQIFHSGGDVVIRLTLCGLTIVLVAASCTSAAAQPPAPQNQTADEWSDFQLRPRSGASESERRAAADAAMQSRRERAAFRARQRMLRAEANAWLGLTPLRPSWPSTPMTHSYYYPRRVIYYPVMD